MGKKKKPAAAADAPPAESDDVSMEPDAGTVALQAADGMGGPAACVVLHWETLRRLGACLGDTLELCSPMGHPVLLGAWASARMPPGRAGLADEVREALGLVGEGLRAGLRARLRRPASAGVGAGGSGAGAVVFGLDTAMASFCPARRFLRS